jgi:hypothetical protein
MLLFLDNGRKLDTRIKGILIIMCVVASYKNVAPFERSCFSVVPCMLLLVGSQSAGHVKSTVYSD